MPALQQKLIAAVAESFFNLLLISFYVGYISIFVTGPAEKITEFTVSNTNVCSINITVNLPGNLAMRHLYLAQLVSRVHQIGGRCVMVQVNAFLYTQKIKLQGALQQVGCVHAQIYVV